MDDKHWTCLTISLLLQLQGSVKRRTVSGLSCVVQAFGYHTPKKDWNRVLNPSPQDSDCRLFHSLFAPGVPQAAFMGIGYGFGSITNGSSMHADGLLRAIKGEIEFPATADEMQAYVVKTSAEQATGTCQNFTKEDYFAGVRKALRGETPAGGFDMPPTKFTGHLERGSCAISQRRLVLAHAALDAWNDARSLALQTKEQKAPLVMATPEVQSELLRLSSSVSSSSGAAVAGIDESNTRLEDIKIYATDFGLARGDVDVLALDASKGGEKFTYGRVLDCALVLANGGVLVLLHSDDDTVLLSALETAERNGGLYLLHRTETRTLADNRTYRVRVLRREVYKASSAAFRNVSSSCSVRTCTPPPAESEDDEDSCGPRSPQPPKFTIQGTTNDAAGARWM